MRRTSYQKGSLRLADRKKGKVWEFLWREVQLDGSIRRKHIVVGTLEELPTESSAQTAVDAIRLEISRQTPQQLVKNDQLRNPCKTLPTTRTAGCVRQDQTRARGCGRGPQVVFDSGDIRGLFEEVDSSALACLLFGT